ncbi:MAG: hypothetical protein ACR2NZ_07855, partial [Rubripirellula sp.]
MIDALIAPGAGETWMRGAIQLSILAVFSRMVLRIARPRLPQESPSLSDCDLWTIGFAAYVVHVLLAFEFVHQWSHNRAWQQTAEETAQVTGLTRGDGIWVNY